MASDHERRKPTRRHLSEGSAHDVASVSVRTPRPAKSAKAARSGRTGKGRRSAVAASPAKATRPAKAPRSERSAKAASPAKTGLRKFSLPGLRRGAAKQKKEITQFTVTTSTPVPMKGTERSLSARLHLPTKRKKEGIIQKKGVVSEADGRRIQRQANKTNLKALVPSAQAVLRGIIICVSLILLVIVVFVILSQTSLFTIENINAIANDHVSSDSILKLISISDDATLLNVDTNAIEESIKRNPWVKEVNVERVFPATLRVSVVERDIDALVVMSSGEVVWILGEGGVWIEPVSISANAQQNFIDIALAKANEMNALLITDSPASVNPVSGETVSDDNLLTVKEFQEGFSASFRKKIACYSAATTTSISCTLKSGVTVSLGSATDISSKEEIVEALLEEYPNMITYINVRVPTSPSYRSINTSDVVQGTGAYGTSDEVNTDQQDLTESETNSKQTEEEQTIQTDES